MSNYWVDLTVLRHGDRCKVAVLIHEADGPGDAIDRAKRIYWEAELGGTIMEASTTELLLDPAFFTPTLLTEPAAKRG